MKMIGINYYSSMKRPWVARILGKDPRWGYKREFLEPVEKKLSGSGKTGTFWFRLEEPGVYEVSRPYKGRYFVYFDGEDFEGGYLSEGAVEQKLKELWREENVEA